MSVKKWQFQSLYEWLFSALFFWIFLACLEMIMAVILNTFPIPLGRAALPSAVDLRYFIAALTIYALFSVPTGLILFFTKKIFAWLKGKTKASFVALNRMDYYLLFGFGLLCFKWISNLMPYLVDADHLPNAPYLFILFLLGLHLWLSGFFKKTTKYYRTQWTIITVGTIFLSKTAYDVFIGSSLSMVARLCLFMLFALGALSIAVVFHKLLNRILLNQIKPKLAYAVLFAILLSGGCLYTLSVFQTKNHFISSLPKTAKSQKGESKIVKNVIVILVDCLRADHLGCYGYTSNTSPFLDRIARSGITFENCITPSSWTIPSVVSLFTGVYPQQHGVNEFGTVIPKSLFTLQEVMENQGSKTAAFITNDYLRPHFGYAKGFSRYFDHYLEQSFKEYIASRLFFLNALMYFKNVLLYPFSVDPGGARWWSIGFPPFNHQKISAERVTNDVLKWIQIHGDKPFYIYLHYMDVHCPYDTIWYPLFDRDIYASQDEKEKLINIYDGRIAYVDQQIKRIWEELIQLNLSDSTLFIITADHGEELYDHEGIGHCTTLYDELIRVPLIMVNPSLPGTGQRVKKQVQLIDLPVTILDFLNLKVPKEMVGQSLFFLISDPPDLSEPAYALSYTTRGRKNLKTGEGRALWEKKVWDQGVILTSLRVDNEWKIIDGDDGRTELYNLKEDAKEQNDLREVDRLMVEDLKKKFMKKVSGLKSFTPTQEKLGLTPDTRDRLRALGYL